MPTTSSPIHGRFVSGRPVAFVGAAPDEALAVRRYGEAYRRIGIHDPAYVYEPVGAAYYHAQRLKSDALVLVCDFGGGTSDFSLLRFERRGSSVGATPIGHAGVAIAGDNFDYRIIDAVVSPLLGKGTQFKSFDKILPIPQHYHASFARWHQLAMLKTPEHIRELDRLKRTSLSPDKIAKLLDVIRSDSGFNIYRAVSDTKVRLSSSASATFALRLGDLDIEQEISRGISSAGSPTMSPRSSTPLISCCKLKASRLEAIDSVFLTGGSSFIPAVRRVFETRSARSA